MISKYINIGDRIDIESISRSLSDTTEKKVYKSQLLDIDSEDRIKVSMPTEQGRVVLLPVDKEFNLCFYTPSGLYQCLGRIVDRLKTDKIFMLDVELTTDIRRYQRREYYRLNCVLTMKSTMITDNDVIHFDEKVHFIDTDLTFDNGTMVDISGGGARFISKVKYPKDSNILFTFDLYVNDALTSYKLIGRVLLSREVSGKEGDYEHRIMFTNIMNDDRESIIKYIFEEERKLRRREKGI